MDRLTQRIRGTANMIDGYKTGVLVVNPEEVYLRPEDSNERICTLDESWIIEVRNGYRYERVTYKEVLTTKTQEDWPLYAGLEARVKKNT